MKNHHHLFVTKCESKVTENKKTACSISSINPKENQCVLLPNHQEKPKERVRLTSLGNQGVVVIALVGVVALGEGLRPPGLLSVRGRNPDDG